MPASDVIPRRRSRFWLYAPYALLLGLAVAWSVGWFVIRQKVVGGLDVWLASEAASGRVWACPDRGVGGYPFRIEIVCPSLAVAAAGTSASLGRLHVAAQVYDPSHVIAEASGPLRLKTADAEVEAGWSLLQTSVHLAGGQPQRGDLVTEKPTLAVTLPGQGTTSLSAERIEIHVRPDPKEATSVDVALAATGAAIPILAQLTGSAEPANLDLVAVVTQARDLPHRPLAPEIERWRLADGRAEIARVAVVQGSRRLEGRGTVSIDELHRPQGQFDLSGQGLDEIVGRFFGGRAASAIGLIGALLGAPPPLPASPGGAGRLTPLPPLRLAGGKLAIGPIVTGVRLPVLY